MLYAVYTAMLKQYTLQSKIVQEASASNFIEYVKYVIHQS